jgi:enoyl-CoA hydratase/carnithine racemase
MPRAHADEAARDMSDELATSPAVHAQRDGHVARVTLHNPAKRNAMCHDMWQSLGDVLDAAHADPGLRVLVLTGAGDKAFCAGNDISEFSSWRNDPEAHARYDATARRAMTLLRTLPMPAVARIRGVCVGGGLEIALACDLRLADTGARFAITPARLGLGYKLEDVSLVLDTVGASAARRLLLTGRIHEADAALAMGLVDAVHPVAELDEAVGELATTIAGNAPLTLRALKAAITEACRPPGERDHERVRRLVDACNASADYQEGQRAFAEKRPPRFQGR